VTDLVRLRELLQQIQHHGGKREGRGTDDNQACGCSSYELAVAP